MKSLIGVAYNVIQIVYGVSVSSTFGASDLLLLFGVGGALLGEADGGAGKQTNVGPFVKTHFFQFE